MGGIENIQPDEVTEVASQRREEDKGPLTLSDWVEAEKTVVEGKPRRKILVFWNKDKK